MLPVVLEDQHVYATIEHKVSGHVTIWQLPHQHSCTFTSERFSVFLINYFVELKFLLGLLLWIYLCDLQNVHPRYLGYVLLVLGSTQVSSLCFPSGHKEPFSAWLFSVFFPHLILLHIPSFLPACMSAHPCCIFLCVSVEIVTMTHRLYLIGWAVVLECCAYLTAQLQVVSVCVCVFIFIHIYVYI